MGDTAFIQNPEKTLYLQHLSRPRYDPTDFSRLKDAPCPVVITKFEEDYHPVRAHLDIRADRTWGAVAMSYRADNMTLARRHFVRALNNYYHYAIKASEQGARDDRAGVWSINRWH